MNQGKGWILSSGGLLAAALVLRFALRGYANWGYTLAFIALLILAHRFLPLVLWRILLLLTCLGLLYFCAVEVPIIRNARTDKVVRRLEGALDYLETYPDSLVIVSGGMGPGETVTEAEAMRGWLMRRGIDEKRILAEDKATSTAQNLEYAFAMIRERGDEPDGRVAIVSSAYHLYRAKSMARLMGVEAAGVAAPWGYPMVMLNYFIREAFGITHLWVFGP